MLGSFEVLDTTFSISYCFRFHFLVTNRFIQSSMILVISANYFTLCFHNGEQFFNSRIWFSGTLCQMFFLCQLTFCGLTRERVRNNPKQEKIVVLISYSSCHKQNLGVFINRSILRTSFTEYLGKKKSPSYPRLFPCGGFSKAEGKMKEP